MLIEFGPDIWEQQNMFTVQECDSILADASRTPLNEWEVAANFGGAKKRTLDSKPETITDSIHQMVSDRILNTINQIIAQYAKYDHNNRIVAKSNKTGRANFRVTHYETGSSYPSHVDTDAGIGMSFVIYMNDEYEGGDTVFTKHKIRYTPKKGNALIFPSTFTHPHEGETITSGQKYILFTGIGLGAGSN